MQQFGNGSSRNPPGNLAPPSTQHGFRILGGLCWVVFTVVLGAFYTRMPPCPDLAIFDYVAWTINSGGTLYLDVVEQNWPGAIWLHRLSSYIFGNHLWSFRTFDYALMCTGAGVLYGLIASRRKSHARWVVVPLYQLMYVTSNLWMVGQRDVIAGEVLVLVGFAHNRRMAGHSRVWMVPVGAGIAFATLIRPTYLVFSVMLLAVAFIFTKRNRIALWQTALDMAFAGAVSIGCIAVVAAYGWITGSLAGWYEYTVLFNLQSYGNETTFLEVTGRILSMGHSWHWYIAFALCGAIIWWRRGDRGIWAILVCIFLTSLLSTYVQGKGFGYHLGAMLPSLAAFAAEFIAWSIENARVQRSIRNLIVAGLICGIAVAGSMKKMAGSYPAQLDFFCGVIDRNTMYKRLNMGIDGLSMKDVLAAANYARRNTKSYDTVLVWSRAVSINYLAERRLSTRFASVNVLEIIRPPFPKAEEYLEEFEQTMINDPPAMIFAPNQKYPDAYHGLFREVSAPRATRFLRSVLSSRYTRTASFGSLDAYLLSDTIQ